jgi:hypothetical protein
MRPLRSTRHSIRHTSSSDYMVFPRITAPSALDGWDETSSRHEPETLSTRFIPTDPYTAWLAQRDAERERDEYQPVRWVRR